MAFKKGTSGNPAGKPKGAVNKTTSDLRQWVTSFIEGNRAQIQKDWQALEPKDRIVLFERLLKYTLPTLQATSLTTDFEKLSDEQLAVIIDNLKSSI